MKTVDLRLTSILMLIVSAFGEDCVPYSRGSATQIGQTVSAFTYWFKLFRGVASSDKAAAALAGS